MSNQGYRARIRAARKPLSPSDHDVLATCLKIACQGTEWTPDIVLRATGSKTCCQQRRLAWYELRKRGWSFPKIAQAFNVDHTSIIYGLQKLGVTLPPRAVSTSAGRTRAKANMALKEARKSKKEDSIKRYCVGAPLTPADEKWAKLIGEEKFASIKTRTAYEYRANDLPERFI